VDDEKRGRRVGVGKRVEKGNGLEGEKKGEEKWEEVKESKGKGERRTKKEGGERKEQQRKCDEVEDCHTQQRRGV